MYGRWLTHFADDKDATLTLKGKTFPKKDCGELGAGKQKRVYKHKDQGQCFIIPNYGNNEEGWNNLIAAEKTLLDQIISLGLKAQQFEITDLTITPKEGEPCTIKVLVTKDFATL